ncbi:MAG: 16S rRNA (cytosine(1402)-N(4))-methyltransferase RsmH [Alphaproteobacteria bacterium]|nr:16S rRNA (cytosine(1402)-N(4))-methyltransferase RsmH [Alphaproteobacteria bacterium]
MTEHIPVLLREVLEFLNPSDGKIYFDGTFGGGGYTRAILDRANCRVIACDRDDYVKPFANVMREKYSDRFMFSHSKFSDIDVVLQQHNVDKLDGIVLDLGLSNFQLMDQHRGFSFRYAGNLDMSMGLCDENAMNAIHRLSERDLANVIYELGEERYSRRIAKNIKLNLKKIKTSENLADIVRSCVRKSGKIDPATKTFQALRIFVNRELEELQIILQKFEKLLNHDGRLVVVSFHSLEDRIVKVAFKKLSSENDRFCILTKKPVVPTKEEMFRNPKSRSAKLRCIHSRIV